MLTCLLLEDGATAAQRSPVPEASVARRRISLFTPVAILIRQSSYIATYLPIRFLQWTAIMFSMSSVQYNKKFVKNFLRDSTVTSLGYNGDTLFIFSDETGIGQRSKYHPVFGLGGCACRGTDYDNLKLTWATLRRDVLGLTDKKKFHASEMWRTLSIKQLRTITEFLAAPSWFRFVSVVTPHSNIHDRISDLSIVIKSATFQVSDLFRHEAPKNVHWIMEHSDHLCRMMLKIGQFPHFYSDSNPTVSISFMTKEAREPGLEISDLISFIVGKYYRHAASETQIYDEQMAAMFSNPSVSRFAHPLTILGPAWINEKGKPIPAPTLESRMGRPPRRRGQSTQ